MSGETRPHGSLGWFVVGRRFDGSDFVKLSDDGPRWVLDIIRDVLHDGGDMLPSDAMWELAADVVDLLLGWGESDIPTSDAVLSAVDEWACCSMSHGDIARWFADALPMSSWVVDEYRDTFGGSGDVSGDMLGGFVLLCERFGVELVQRYREHLHA